MIRERHISRSRRQLLFSPARVGREKNGGEEKKKKFRLRDGGRGGVKITSIPEVIIALCDRDYAGQQI